MERKGLAACAALIAALAGLLAPGTPDAQPAGEDRAASLARVGEAVASQGASGRLVERTPGRYLFVPEGEGVMLPVANPESVAATAVGPMLRVSGRLDTESGEIELGDVRLDLGPSSRASALTEAAPEGFRANIRTNTLERELGTIVADFAQTVDRALVPGAMSVESLDPEGTGAVPDQDRRTTAELAGLYARAREAGNKAVQDATVERYADIRQTLKALYGTYDNYQPWSYDQIYRNANAVVAIGRPDRSEAICSGVLVGADLVLTAGHCFEDHAPEDLEVWFDFVEDRDNLREPQRRQINALVAPSLDKREAFEDQAFGPDLYDYAIVRFVQDGAEGPPIPAVPLASCRIEPAAAPPADATAEEQAAWPALVAEWKARCVRQPQCLSDGRARRGDAVYVIGFPRGTRERVHDNGRVYLPYQLTRREFQELSIEIALDYKENPDREQILAEFTDSYVPRETRFVLEDVRFGRQPKIGIVADTFRGNSGSPVYDRSSGNHCLIGLLIGGAEDSGQRLMASWLHHEAVLPMSAILRDLGAHDDTKALIDGKLLDVR